MDLGSIAAWAALAFSIASFAVSILRDRSKDSARRFSEFKETIEAKIEGKASADLVGTLAAKIDKVEDRVVIIETGLKHLPDKDATHKLEMGIAELSAQVREMSAQMKPISSTMARLQDAILENLANR